MSRHSGQRAIGLKEPQSGVFGGVLLLLGAPCVASHGGDGWGAMCGRGAGGVRADGGSRSLGGFGGPDSYRRGTWFGAAGHLVGEGVKPRVDRGHVGTTPWLQRGHLMDQVGQSLGEASGRSKVHFSGVLCLTRASNT